MMNLVGIKTGNTLLISKDSNVNPYLDTFIFNENLKAEKSFTPGWYKLDAENIYSIKKVIKEEKYKRFEIKNKSLINDKIPEYLYLDNPNIYFDYDDDEYDYVFINELEGLRDLYTLKSEYVDSIQEEEFTYTEVFNLPEEIKEINFEYEKYIYKDKYEPIIEYQLIDKILFPKPLIQFKPCKIEADKLFQIVRSYIKEYIDNEYAFISSDYDFCLTVQKKIKLSKTESYIIDENYNIFSKRRKKPKYVTKYRYDRSVVVFECAPKAYQNYTVLKPLEAKNHEDLNEKLKSYLEGIIEEINKPLTTCPHCDGLGVVDEKTLKSIII